MQEVFSDSTQDTVKLRQRLEYYRETGNKIGEVLTYRTLGVQARYASQFRTAIELHMAGLEIAREIADTVNITILLNDLATNFRRIGAYNEALPYSFLSLQTAQQYRGPDSLPIQRNMASAYNGIGNIYLPMEQYDEALKVFEKALELDSRQDNHWGIAVNLSNIGSIHFSRGEYALAEDFYRRSMEHNALANQLVGTALGHINLGELFQAQNRLDDALGEYHKAYDALKGSTDQLHWLDACFNIANIHMEEGRLSRAVPYLEEGLLKAQEIHSIKHLSRAYDLYSTYNYERGDYHRAVDDLRAVQAYDDTLRQNQEANRLLESRLQYETAQYSRRIEELDGINQRQLMRRKMEAMIAVPLFVALLVVLVFLYLRRRLKEREAREVKALERMRSNFFTNITHELRTPITVINGLASRLREEVKDATEREAKDLDAICRQGENLMHLVNQLLEFSRSEAGIDRLRWRRGDVVEYLRIIAEPFACFAQNKGVRLVVYSETGSLEVNFAPSSLKKVMANLLSNAVRHCGEGDEIILHIRYDGPSRRCLIRVKDSGEGIAPDKLPRIFELYYTSASGNAGQTGSGIGLALSKQLVEEMGGEIGVESTLGKGAEFTVSLPVSTAEIPEDELVQAAEPSEATPDVWSEEDTVLEPKTSKGKKTVLVIEDSRDVAHYIATILEGKYSVIHASNGNEGLLAAEQHIPDLIITDVMMPEKDGLAFTVELRASVAISHIPVIMVTARSTTEDKLEGLRAGVDAWLAKPFDERELLARIKQLLDSRARLMEVYSDALFRSERAQTASNDQNMAFITRLSVAVNAHLDDEGWFPDGLAAEMCLSESQLGRKLKAMTGHTISSFVMRARLNKAKQLLSRRDRSIKEVAFACGFADLSYFSRSFRKVFGYTPSEFLKIPEQQG